MTVRTAAFWIACLAAAVGCRSPLPAEPPAVASATIPNGLSNATVLIVRHAEKPWAGRGLARRGIARAQAYPAYFQGFEIDGRPVRIDALVAAADSDHSERSTLTLTPLGAALGRPVQQPVKSYAVRRLVQWIEAGQPGRTILVAWHHGDVPRLLAALGEDPGALLPHGRWPSSVYDRVIVLRFDGQAAIIPAASRIVKETIALHR